MKLTPKNLATLASAPLLAASVGLVHAMPADAQAASAHEGGLTRQEIKNYQGARASHLIGTRVSDKQGQPLGKIDDLVIHMSTGDVRYAILAHQAGGGDERLFAVPLDRLSMRQSGQLSVNIGGNELGNQKWWQKDKWPGLQDSAFWGEVDRLSGLPAVQPSEKYYAHRVSDLIGKDVQNPAGKDLGTVRDLVINVNDKSVHYAILDFQGAGAGADRRFAVPITALMFPRAGEEHKLQTDHLVLNVQPSAVQQMHSFSDNAWPDFSSPARTAQIDRYLILFFPDTAAGGTSGVASSGSGSMASGGTRGSLFDRLDRNGDGVLSRSEYSELQQRDAAGGSGGTSGGASGGTSGGASGGTSGGASGYTSGGTPGTAMGGASGGTSGSAIGGTSGSVFDQFDSNRDGMISRSEYADFHQREADSQRQAGSIGARR